MHRLRRLVEDVLGVARLDVPGIEQAQREEVRLGELAHRAVAATGREVERILANLVTNAHRQGVPPVTLEVDGQKARSASVPGHGSVAPGSVWA
ncbi:hypothetical protein ACVB8X_01640 [Streptomyces sp. NRAIS4]